MGIKGAKAQAAQVEHYKRLARQKMLEEEMKKLRHVLSSMS